MNDNISIYLNYNTLLFQKNIAVKFGQIFDIFGNRNKKEDENICLPYTWRGIYFHLRYSCSDILIL